MLLILMTIFMPKVWHTRSQIADIWFEWKWMAIRSNISPKEAVRPVAASKCDSSVISHLIQSTAIFSFSEVEVNELQAIRTQRPSETNLTPAAVNGGLHVIISNMAETSSSDSL